ncbi:MAG: hypothetical protein Q7T63_03270 [Burkholderiaceae bacterium]|nr:hypothetical protein [Burkholderiaceae bacterium]
MSLMSQVLRAVRRQTPVATHSDRPGPLGDPTSLAQWWSSLDFLNAETRLLVAEQALAHCTHGECRRRLVEARQALLEFLQPRPLAFVLSDALRRLAGTHPVFCAIAAAALILLAWRCATRLHALVLGLIRS